MKEVLVYTSSEKEDRHFQFEGYLHRFSYVLKYEATFAIVEDFDGNLYDISINCLRMKTPHHLDTAKNIDDLIKKKEEGKRRRNAYREEGKRRKNAYDDACDDLDRRYAVENQSEVLDMNLEG